MNRLIVAVLCLLCAAIAPALLLLMLGQAVFGSQARAQGAANSIDEAVNCIFGGDQRETISRRTGLAVIAGKPWGIWLAPKIDLFFGQDHCRRKALEILTN